MSVPDQYMVRGGVNYMVNKFNFSGGMRIEGIPSSDLVGGDKGFRRPGIVTSVEPTVSYTTKKRKSLFISAVCCDTQSHTKLFRQIALLLIPEQKYREMQLLLIILSMSDSLSGFNYQNN